MNSVHDIGDAERARAVKALQDVDEIIAASVSEGGTTDARDLATDLVADIALTCELLDLGAAQLRWMYAAAITRAIQLQPPF